MSQNKYKKHNKQYKTPTTASGSNDKVIVVASLDDKGNTTVNRKFLQKIEKKSVEKKHVLKTQAPKVETIEGEITTAFDYLRRGRNSGFNRI